MTQITGLEAKTIRREGTNSPRNGGPPVESGPAGRWRRPAGRKGDPLIADRGGAGAVVSARNRRGPDGRPEWVRSQFAAPEWSVSEVGQVPARRPWAGCYVAEVLAQGQSQRAGAGSAHRSGIPSYATSRSSRQCIGRPPADHQRRYQEAGTDRRLQECTGAGDGSGARSRRECMTFPSEALGRSVPYGVYECKRNQGYCAGRYLGRHAPVAVTAIRPGGSRGAGRLPGPAWAASPRRCRGKQ